MFEDRLCPNAVCCLEKELDGCYECGRLEACETGFFSTDEKVAKGTALFIQKYDKNKYDKTLKKAIANGVRYPEDFNETADVYKMVEMLEKYNK